VDANAQNAVHMAIVITNVNKIISETEDIINRGVNGKKWPWK
jgi:hypothetical protein